MSPPSCVAYRSGAVPDLFVPFTRQFAASLHVIMIFPNPDNVEGSVTGVDQVAAPSWVKVSSSDEVVVS